MHKFCLPAVTDALGGPSFSPTTERLEAEKWTGQVVAVTDEECTKNPGDVLLDVLRGLRRRRNDVAEALDGNALRVELTLTDHEPRRTFRIIFTGEGNVVLSDPSTMSTVDFAPHLDLRCGVGDLRRLVLGELGFVEASERGVVVAHVDPRPLNNMRRVIAFQLRSVLGESVG